MNRRDFMIASLALASGLAMTNAAMAQDTVKIGYIDPLSGGGASIGEVGLKTFQFLADELNAKGGILGKKVEIVPYDNKTNPQESLIQAQKAIDAGVRYLTQGNGSSVAIALAEFVNKYYNDSTGEGELGKDATGPWNTGGDWEVVESPAFKAIQERASER